MSFYNILIENAKPGIMFECICQTCIEMGEIDSTNKSAMKCEKSKLIHSFTTKKKLHTQLIAFYGFNRNSKNWKKVTVLCLK